MHFLDEPACAAVGGGLRPDARVIALPDPLPGMPYPAPGLELR